LNQLNIVMPSRTCQVENKKFQQLLQIKYSIDALVTRA
jgi:hypothetical protein